MPTKKLPKNTKFNVAGLIVVALFAALGVKLLLNSSAASPAPTPVVGFYNYTDVANNDGVNVFTSQDSVPGIGAQYVADILPGKQLLFVAGGKLVPTNTCYYLRVYNSAKSLVQVSSGDVTVVGTNSSRTVTLPADANYREVCVPSGKQAQLPYNVANLSSSAYVLVYAAEVQY